jgi:hypothetical protein
VRPPHYNALGYSGEKRKEKGKGFTSQSDKGRTPMWVELITFPALSEGETPHMSTLQSNSEMKIIERELKGFAFQSDKGRTPMWVELITFPALSEGETPHMSTL